MHSVTVTFVLYKRIHLNKNFCIWVFILSTIPWKIETNNLGNHLDTVDAVLISVPSQHSTSVANIASGSGSADSGPLVTQPNPTPPVPRRDPTHQVTLSGSSTSRRTSK